MGYRSDVALKFARTDLEEDPVNSRDPDGLKVRYMRYKNEMNHRSLIMEEHITTSLIDEPEEGSLPLPVGLLSLLQNELGAEMYLEGMYVTALITYVKWYDDTYPSIQAVMSLLASLDNQELYEYYGYCRFGEELGDQAQEGLIDAAPYVSRHIILDLPKDHEVVNY
tara:strand:+ start:958 stop:1458 length:501 start_codon:yes stop_codon:yes gene_type:complete